MATQSSEHDPQMDHATGEHGRVRERRPAITISWRDHMTRWLPHIDAGAFNPVFRLEARRRLSPDALGGRSLRWMAQTALVVVGLWLAAALMIAFTGGGEGAYRALLEVLGLLALASLLDKFILDFSAVTASLDAIEDDVRHGHFDLLCLTDVRMNAYLKAKHAVAQMRSWRLMCRDMGFRLGLVLAMIGHIGLLFINALQQSAGVLDDVEPVPVWGLLILLAGGGLLVAVYVLEPRWRLRALAAASIAVSTQRKSAPFSFLYALGTLISVSIMQVLMAIAAIVALSQLMSLMLLSTFTALVTLLLWALLVGMIVRIGYRVLIDTWLTRSWRRLVAWGGLP